MECNTAVLVERENFLDHPLEEDFMLSATQDLQTDIEKVRVSLQNKTLALQRVQIMAALRKKLKQDDEDSRLILKTMENIVLLSQKISEYQQQAHQKEQQLIDIKNRRLLLKKREQQLQEIQAMREKQKEKQKSVNVTEMENMLEVLEKEREITTILQSVFQNIVFGSGVNWAEDPSLKEIILRLEKNVYLQ
ncbi:centromere protein H [Catharus ustulatus]|uniref:Centromere protein H n=1 Tax=Catharus ustulatus TaxID=91951 RepID=A0A8C3UFQ4_CATUS|nr:centromere protein H [Catharus ustulatus]